MKKTSIYLCVDGHFRTVIPLYLTCPRMASSPSQKKNSIHFSRSQGKVRTVRTIVAFPCPLLFAPFRPSSSRRAHPKTPGDAALGVCRLCFALRLARSLSLLLPARAGYFSPRENTKASWPWSWLWLWLWLWLCIPTAVSPTSCPAQGCPSCFVSAVWSFPRQPRHGQDQEKAYEGTEG